MSASIFVSFFSTDKTVIKLIVFLKFLLSSLRISQVVSLSFSFRVFAELKSQNAIQKICRNEKSVFLYSFFLFLVDQPKKFQFPSVFSRYGRNMNHKSISCLFLSIKICEELSAKQKLESQQILSLQNRQVESRSGQFVKDFIPNCRTVFSFLL
jgi:hypothetical protein